MSPAPLATLLAAAEPGWPLDRLPRALLEMGPRPLLRWQWLALLLLGLLALGAGIALGRVSRIALQRLARRTSPAWDDAFVARVGAPLALAWALLLFYLALPLLDLPRGARAFAGDALRGLVLFDFFWFVMRIVDVGARLVARSPWAAEHPASRSLVPLGARLGKVLVLALAAVAMLAELGFSVTSLVAGLGLGGLALALAAQKTVENLFGAFSLGVDQPFREGDVVKVEDFVATVERVGLRSTRFRTLDRTVISIPNGRLADMRLESYTERDRLRLTCTVALARGATADQVRAVLVGLEGVLREHPRITGEAPVVRLRDFGESSLDIEVAAYFGTTDWAEFQLIRQELLLAFMDVVEKEGAALAVPARHVHLRRE